jgi:hypothetical protein
MIFGWLYAELAFSISGHELVCGQNCNADRLLHLNEALRKLCGNSLSYFSFDGEMAVV